MRFFFALRQVFQQPASDDSPARPLESDILWCVCLLPSVMSTQSFLFTPIPHARATHATFTQRPGGHG